jgi:hypothetical protein
MVLNFTASSDIYEKVLVSFYGGRPEMTLFPYDGPVIQKLECEIEY